MISINFAAMEFNVTSMLINYRDWGIGEAFQVVWTPDGRLDKTRLFIASSDAQSLSNPKLRTSY